MTSEPLLEIEDLNIRYNIDEGRVCAVNDASFLLSEKEYLGVIGESGSGKSTLSQAVIGGLDSNGEIASGKIKYKGKEIQNYSEERFNEEIRWKEISVIPQGAMNSLDPLMTVSEQAIDIAQTHEDWSREESLNRLRELFEIVGLAESRIHGYPHQFSGGMKQRAIIALALLLDPSLIIADEPTTALDVIMQDQILEYLDKSKEVMDVSLMLITHDISVVFDICESVVVMHGGQVAEFGSTTDIYDDPRHPYTLMLQEAFPDVRHPNRELGIIKGAQSIQYNEVNYCTFTERCPWAKEECSAQAPPLEPVDGDFTHGSSCIRSDEIVALQKEREEKMERSNQGGRKE